MKKLFSALLLFPMICMGMLAAEAGPARADDVITWKAPCHWPSSSVSFQDSLAAVAELVKERTDGRLVIEPYEAGALIPGPQVFTAVKRGMFPIGVTSADYNSDEVPILAICGGLPINFADVWEGVYFEKWMGFGDMVSDILLEKHGLMYFPDRMYTTELSMQKPIRSFEDFDGVKIRSSGTLQKYLASIGAATEFIPGGDVYAALASGMIDGAHWGAVQGSSSMKFYEINKYHLRPPLRIAATDIWLINKKAFDNLPEDIQDILVSTLEEHFWRRTNQYKYQEELELAKVQKEQDVELLTMPPDEFAKMQEAAIVMWDEIAGKSPACAEAVDILKQFNRDMGRID